MFKKIILLEFLFLLYLFSCSNKSIPDTKYKFNEDLSQYRPEFTRKEINHADTISIEEFSSETYEITPDLSKPEDLTMELDSLLDSIAENNREKGYIQGYTIQVYTGNDREKAEEAKAMIYELLPDAIPKLQYIQPNFKVKIGTYYSRLEAHKMYKKLKNDFPNAIIIPERIYKE